MVVLLMEPQPKTKPDGTYYADRYNKSENWAIWLPDNRMTEPRTWKEPFSIGEIIGVREAFRCMWDSHNPDLLWAEKPWVWMFGTELVKGD
jgi:hypothetical protein